MYEKTFNFQVRPFNLTASVASYFAGESIHSALAQCRLCVERGSGPAIITGPPGVGKSLLLQMLAHQFQTDFTVVSVLCARLGERRDLLQNILFELQRDYRGLTEGELRLNLIDFLKSEQCGQRGMLLLVDEADSLSVDLLDELRLITNFVRDGRPHVSLVMAGSPSLEEHLIDTRSESFNQRVAARCYLTHFRQSETIEYILTQVERAGGVGEELFTAEAMNLVHEASEGCPRIINQICDYALLVASSLQVDRVTADVVRQAWDDVQNLPGKLSRTDGPDTGQTACTSFPSDSGVVEFGELNENVTAAACETHECDGQTRPQDPVAAAPSMPCADQGVQTNAKEDTDPPGGSSAAKAQPKPADLSVLSDDIDSNSFDDHGNPFDEPFAEEEAVPNDAFFPEVSEQNLAALTLKPEDLGFLDRLPARSADENVSAVATSNETQAPPNQPSISSHLKEYREDLRLSERQLSDLDRVQQDVQRLQSEFDGPFNVEPQNRSDHDVRASTGAPISREISGRDDQPIEEFMQTPLPPFGHDPDADCPSEGVASKVYPVKDTRIDDDQDIMIIHGSGRHDDDESDQSTPQLDRIRNMSAGSAERMDYQDLFRQLRRDD